MRPALHRAALRRLAIRVAVLLACVLAGAAVFLPSGWVSVDAGYARLGAFAAAAAVAAGTSLLAMMRRPRTRVTAPRALVSRA